MAAALDAVEERSGKWPRPRGFRSGASDLSAGYAKEVGGVQLEEVGREDAIADDGRGQPQVGLRERCRLGD